MSGQQYPRPFEVIPSFVPPEILDHLSAYAASTYAELDRQIEQGTAHPDFVQSLLWDGLCFQALKAHAQGSEPIGRMAAHIEGCFPGARVIDEHSVFRRQRKDITYVGWHTDAHAAGSTRYDPCFNVWIPFSEVGETLPSLEILPESESIMRTETDLPLDASNNLPDEWRRNRLAHLETLCPHLKPGDALVFSHYTLHRTQPMKLRGGARISAEFRFTMKALEHPTSTRGQGAQGHRRESHWPL